MQQVTVQHRVGKLQNFTKRGFIRVIVLWVAFVQVANEKLIQFTHATPALPAKAGFLAQYFRSTSIFLVSAIASAGLRPFGHVCVQFIIV